MTAALDNGKLQAMSKATYTLSNSTISFGPLTVPVKVMPASKSSDVGFKMCSPEGQPVEQVYRDPSGKIFTFGECERIFDGHVLKVEDIKAIDAECAIEDGKDLKHLNIESFVSLKALALHRMVKSYYVAPDPKRGGLDALGIIVKTLKKKKVAAICKWCPRNRQEVLALFVDGDCLRAVALNFNANCLEAPDSMELLVNIKPDPRYLTVMEQLVDAYTDAEASIIDTLADSAIERRRALAEAAALGEKIEPTEPSAPAPTSDLMEALEAALRAATSKKVAA